MSDVNQVAPADYAAEMAQLSGETAPVVEQAVETTPVVDNAVESDTFDPSTLSPSAKAHWDKQQQAIESERRRAKDFETRYATLHGRVSPLQREVERLKRQQTQAPRPAPAAPAPVSKESLQNWDKYRSELPDEAAAIEQFLKAQLRDELGRFQPIPEDVAALRKELAELREKELSPRFQELDQIREAREQEYVAKVQGEVLGKHADWNDHFQFDFDENNQLRILHESPQMAAWLDTQPKAVIQALMSDEVEECIWAMDLFKASIAVAEQPNTQAATELQQKREKNLQSRAVTSTAGLGMARQDPSKLPDKDRYELEMKQLLG